MFVPSGSSCLPLPHSGRSVFCLYFDLCPPWHAVICVRLFIWVMLPTCPLGSQVSGLRKAMSESHRDYWAFCGSPWFWGWWEVRTFPMEAINFHIWIAIHLNQIISDQKDVLWWALNLSLLPTVLICFQTFNTTAPSGLSVHMELTQAQHWLVLLSLFLQEENEQPS